jgi:hypothetical protein
VFPPWGGRGRALRACGGEGNQNKSHGEQAGQERAPCEVARAIAKKRHAFRSPSTSAKLYHLSRAVVIANFEKRLCS